MYYTIKQMAEMFGVTEHKHWYRLAALQGHDLAIEKCKELGVALYFFIAT